MTMVRHMFLAAAFMTFAKADECSDLCAEVPDCTAAGLGSYCKSTNECFGLFFVDETKTAKCFQPGNKDCKENLPVSCTFASAPSV